MQGQPFQEGWAEEEELAGQGDRLPGGLVQALAELGPLADLSAGELWHYVRAGAIVGAGDRSRQLGEVATGGCPLLEGRGV